MTANTIPFLYLTQGVAAISSVGLLIFSIFAKTREKLNGVLWGLLATLISWIVPIAIMLLFKCPIGLEVILFWIAGVISAALMIVTLIITLIRKRKMHPSDNPEKQKWLYIYIVPFIMLTISLLFDVYHVQNADIFLLEDTIDFYAPNKYYAINKKRCVLLGVDKDIIVKTKPVYFSFDKLESDYSTPQNPHMKWTLCVDERLDNTIRKDIIHTGYTIMCSEFMSKFQDKPYDITIYDLYNTGYYHVEIESEQNLTCAIFYKDQFITTTKMTYPDSIYLPK